MPIQTCRTALQAREEFIKAFRKYDQDEYIYDEPGSKDDQYHDDGCLHVVRNGVRAAFDVSNCQSDSPAEQNKKTRLVFKILGLPSRLLTDRVLLPEVSDEDPDEDED